MGVLFADSVLVLEPWGWPEEFLWSADWKGGSACSDRMGQIRLELGLTGSSRPILPLFLTLVAEMTTPANLPAAL